MEQSSMHDGLLVRRKRRPPGRKLPQQTRKGLKYSEIFKKRLDDFANTDYLELLLKLPHIAWRI